MDLGVWGIRHLGSKGFRDLGIWGLMYLGFRGLGKPSAAHRVFSTVLLYSTVVLYTIPTA